MADSNPQAMDEKVISFIESLASAAQASPFKQSTWYCTASCAFAACNQGKYVATIFKAAIRPYGDNFEKHHEILRRIKGKVNRTRRLLDIADASPKSLFKTGMIYGIPRLISAFRALVAALPSPASNETSSLREHIRIPSETDSRGLEYMRNIFRAGLDPFISAMDTYWPDLRTFVVTTIYGYYQSETSILDAVTTSMCNISCLVPMDVPAEVGWHMRRLEELVRRAFETALDAAEICDVQLKNETPKVEEVIHEERLF